MSRVHATGKAMAGSGPLTGRLLERVLDTPNLLQRVRSLAPSRLTELIRQVGLEDAGEIVELASSSQLARLFDEDVWVTGAGAEQEELSADRFALWLEVIAEGGEETVAERLVSLPSAMVHLGFSKLIVVLNDERLERLAMAMDEEDADELDKRLDGFSQEQWQEFRVLSRVERHWDTAWSSLISLDARHSSELRTILEHCERLSRELLDKQEDATDVFDALDEVEEEARGERDARRSREGYVALQDARAFLRLATAGTRYDSGRDPVSRAYFRELGLTRDATENRSRKPAAPRGSWVGRLDPALGQEMTQSAVAESWLFAAALAELSKQAPEIAALRKGEVAYLVNVVMSAGQALEQKLRAGEALELVVQVLAQGLLEHLRAEKSSAPQSGSSTIQVVAEVPSDQLFRAGWQSDSKLEERVKEWRRRLIESLQPSSRRIPR
jgi:hypothetical protein